MRRGPNRAMVTIPERIAIRLAFATGLVIATRTSGEPRVNHETFIYCRRTFPAPGARRFCARVVCPRTIRPGTNHGLLGQRRRWFGSLDTAASVRHRRTLARRTLRGRSAPDSLRQQSNASRWPLAGRRYRLRCREPQSRTALRPDRTRTKRPRHRPLFRNQGTGIELGGQKPLLHAGAGFSARPAATGDSPYAESPRSIFPRS
jgi:hypothetical protein